MNIAELKNKILKGESQEIKLERKVYCRQCGAYMIKRKSKPGLKSKYWYGCSDYPGCRGIILDINLKEKHYKKPEYDEDGWGIN